MTKEYNLLGEDIELDSNLNTESICVFAQLNTLYYHGSTSQLNTYWNQVKYFSPQQGGRVIDYIEKRIKVISEESV